VRVVALLALLSFAFCSAANDFEKVQVQFCMLYTSFRDTEA
jgi:hypothetical protein